MKNYFNKMVDKKLRKDLIVFEFFSGIGGFHQALKQIDKIRIKEIFPFDINPNANEVYKHNFHLSPFVITLDSFYIEQYEELCIKYCNNDEILWVMSPPCQPFTRQGNIKGLEDKRTDGFKQLLKILKETKYKPTYFALENVKNFEVPNI